MPIKHTRDQEKALELLGSDSRHVLLRGGARSGKTVILLEALLTRALAAPGSRHLVARFRANSLNSIFGPSGSFFWVLDHGFPEEVRDRTKAKTQDGVYILPNGSEVWHGGLDDPKRVDKLLGNEYATVYVNEASQVPWGSFTTVLTRLAQVADVKATGQQLRQRCYIDCNPPPETHWLHRVFMLHQDPETRRVLANPGDWVTMLMNPEGNAVNLDPAFIESLKNLPERQRKRFWLGQFGDAGEAALWTAELIDQQRILDATKLPQFTRIAVIVDPSGADDIEDTTADEIGIGVVALGTDGRAYVLEDLTMKGSPAEWGKVATDAYDRYGANAIVGEANFGGAMVRHVIQTAKPGVAYFEVTASRGKHLRAEPVSALWEQDKVRIVGRMPDLEDEMCIVAGTMIETARGQVPIEEIIAGDKVMTRDGYAPVKAAGQTGVSASLVQLCIQESTIEVTPCHPIFVRDKFVSARFVHRSDRLLVSRNWGPTGLRSHGVGDGIIGCEQGTSNTPRASFFIAQFARRMASKFLQAGMSITEMAIRVIIASKTLSLSAAPITTSDMRLGGLKPLGAMQGSRLQRSYGPPSNRGSLPASSAGPRAPRSFGDSNSIAASSVKGVRFIDVPVPVPVFNLEVESGYLPEYFANGILVHNCAMTTAGYTGTKSPNRLDWMVWGVTYLFPKIIAEAKAQERNGFARPVEPRVNVARAHLKGRGRR